MKKYFKMICRIYYRNTFLHLGHCQTVHYNNNYAEQHDGKCLAVIDDRQYGANVQMIEEDINYMKLKHITCLSVTSDLPKIQAFTQDLYNKGLIFIDTDPSPVIQDRNQSFSNRISEQYTSPSLNNFTPSPPLLFGRSNTSTSTSSNTFNNLNQICKLRLNTTGYPIIAYTKHNYGSNYSLIYIFDYIIKVIDNIYKVTDVIKTTNNDISDDNILNFFSGLNNIKIQYHDL